MSFVNMSLGEFLNQLASGKPTPGGGSVAALSGALSSALCSMVARVTYGKEKYRDAWDDMENIMLRGDRLRECFMELVDADVKAYEEVVAAMGMPKTTDEETAGRREALARANRKATEVPLKTASLMVEIVNWLKIIVEKGNPNCISDAGTAVGLIQAATQAAAYNVRFNLLGIDDNEFVEICRGQLEQIVIEIDTAVEQLEKKVLAAIS